MGLRSVWPWPVPSFLGEGFDLYFSRRRRDNDNDPTRPVPSSKIVVGSGTGVIVASPPNVWGSVNVPVGMIVSLWVIENGLQRHGRR